MSLITSIRFNRLHLVPVSELRSPTVKAISGGMGFSANLGFLFADRTLPEAIRAAAGAGFEAVECHFPYDVPATQVAAALRETGLPMVSINTVRGGSGEFGLAALPGREAEARAVIVQATDYAAAVGARAVHVLAGATDGGAAAERTFRDNLAFACDRAESRGLTVLIEPISRGQAPGYHLSRVEHAAEIVVALARPSLRIMFDCYHVQIGQGDLTRRFRAHLPMIGHVQIAAVPDRGEPDGGEVCYRDVIAQMREMGYRGHIGAEYRPRYGATEAGLGWLAGFGRPERGEP